MTNGDKIDLDRLTPAQIKELGGSAKAVAEASAREKAIELASAVRAVGLDAAPGLDPIEHARRLCLSGCEGAGENAVRQARLAAKAAKHGHRGLSTELLKDASGSLLVAGWALPRWQYNEFERLATEAAAVAKGQDDDEDRFFASVDATAQLGELLRHRMDMTEELGSCLDCYSAGDRLHKAATGKSVLDTLLAEEAEAKPKEPGPETYTMRRAGRTGVFERVRTRKLGDPAAKAGG